MRICISHRLTIMCAQKWCSWGFWGRRCENIVFWPPKGTTLREYASVDVSHVKIGSTAWALGPWKDFAYKEEIINKSSGDFGYMGRSNPWGDFDHMWRVGRYGGHNHVCNISWLSVKGCGCGKKGKFAFSHWLDASPLQHWSHYRVTVWSGILSSVARVDLVVVCLPQRTTSHETLVIVVYTRRRRVDLHVDVLRHETLSTLLVCRPRCPRT